jgi:hypothetical protein
MGHNVRCSIVVPEALDEQIERSRGHIPRSIWYKRAAEHFIECEKSKEYAVKAGQLEEFG